MYPAHLGFMDFLPAQLLSVLPLPPALALPELCFRLLLRLMWPDTCILHPAAVAIWGVGGPSCPAVWRAIRERLTAGPGVTYVSYC